MLEQPRVGKSEVPGAGELHAAIGAFWRHHERYREPHRESVGFLTQRALADEPRAASAGTRALFEHVIEPLCDGFTEQGAATYARVLAQIVVAACAVKRCRPLGRTLALHGIRTEGDLLAAAARAGTLPSARRPETSRARQGRIRRIVVLSRLTLGADIAITLPLIRRAEAAFPDARVLLVGGASADVVARACGERIEHASIPYKRGDDLAARLNAWPALRRAVQTACAGRAAEECLILDPDSRSTQLGLLLPGGGCEYRHFPSRFYASGTSDPLGVLATQWFDETFGFAHATAASGLQLDARDAKWARELRARVGRGRPVAAVSFGVGGNQRKSAGIGFEVRLLEWIVRRGCAVLLARGAGDTEVEHTYRIARTLGQRGVSILHLPAGRSLDSIAGRWADIVTWEADVGAFFSAVACADIYVGYDSAGQHIAASLGVPTLSVFIEASGPRHADRWRPCGGGPIRVVRSAAPADAAELFSRASGAFADLATVAGTGVARRGAS